ncbi:hypothetical protein [Desulfosudis oleivorans]|uniref:Uncharacterized protein n=1 Tax=Desulfosudis oleivorans (strain DSM 6200 / JCM 39069 / Hxd3) TaxID=96561 RepID=A8ZS64_DESOH|nr:hypothetical protein [Desulfosudis oleivorans]ABW66082.1 hypothetical protein Dole_0272 [Desulfosudis oleivorans Hxd3]
MPTIDELKAQLAALEEKLEEARARMPAHSTKPLTMRTLLDLEDERDALLGKIEKAGKE